MDSELFGGLERSEREREEIISGRRAVIAALERTGENHKPFVLKAETLEERMERIALLSPTIKTTVLGACRDYEYDNPKRVYDIVVADLRNAGGHKPGCDCAFCTDHKGKGFGDTTDEADDNESEPDDDEDDNDTKEARTAAEPQAGGGSTYQSESLDLGANDTGLQDTGSPKINKGRVPKDGLKPIEIDSKDHPLDRQSMDEIPQGKPYESGGGFDPDSTKRPRKTVDADSPMQPEHNVAPHTDTFSDKGQANPVTEVALARVAGTKWSVVESGR